MVSDQRTELLRIGKLHDLCVVESKRTPVDRKVLKSLISAITQSLIKYGRIEESTFYGYQRLLKLSDTLLQALNTEQKVGILIEDYLVVVESTLMYEDLVLGYNLELFAKFTLMRHGQTQYTGQGIDLTEEGQAIVLSKKEILSEYVDKQKEEAVLISSGAARAKGTLGLIFPEEQRFVSDLVLHMQMKDPAKVGEWFAANFNPNMTPAEKIAQADRFYVEKRFPEEIFGPHGESESRFFYSAEVALRYASNLKKKAGKVPHFFVVSHFEFLNHFVMALFNLQVGNTLTTAEHVEISVLAHDRVISRERVPLIIRFRNSVQKILFNRQKRCFEKWTP